MSTPFLSVEKSNKEFLYSRDEDLVKLSLAEKVKRTQRQVVLHELTIRHYYAKEYDIIKKELAWLEERAIALKERRESIITGYSGMWLPSLKPPLPWDYVKSILKHRDTIVNELIKYRSVCVFSSHSLWTSSSLDVPAGVTQEEDHTGFLIHLLSAVRALIFLARRVQPFLSLVDREVKFCVLTI